MDSFLIIISVRWGPGETARRSTKNRFNRLRSTFVRRIIDLFRSFKHFRCFQLLIPIFRSSCKAKSTGKSKTFWIGPKSKKSDIRRNLPFSSSTSRKSRNATNSVSVFDLKVNQTKKKPKTRWEFLSTTSILKRWASSLPSH